MLQKLFLSLILCISCLEGFPQQGKFSMTAIDSIINESIDQKLIPGATYAFYADSVSVNKSFGFSRLDPEIQFSDSTLVQAGSIGKLFTAIAVLMEVEKGRLDLYAGIKKYLTDWDLNNNEYANITLHQLLTHSSGLDDRNIGMLARSIQSKTPLNEHLRERMPGVFQEAGYSINYSNYGYALAGLIIEKTSSETFEDYIHENILRPLEMNHTSYKLPDNYEEDDSFAIGYQTKRSGFISTKLYPRNIVPAGSLITNSLDMQKFIAEITNHQELMAKNSYEKLFSEQFSNHPALPGYTYGFKKPNWSEDLFLKGGKVPGFLSTIIIDPSKQAGLFISFNTETDNINRKLLNRIKKDNLNHETEKHGEKSINVDLSEFTGSFLNDRINHHSIETFFSTFSNSVQITAQGNALKFENGKTKIFKAISDTLFINENDQFDYLVFTDFQNGKYQQIFNSTDVSGISMPSSFSRIPYWFSSDFLNTYFPFIILIIFLVIPAILIWVAIWAFQKRGKLLNIRLLSFKFFIIPILFLTLLILDIVFFWIPLMNNFNELLFGFPTQYGLFKYFHLGMVVLALAMVPLTYYVWKKRKGGFAIKLFITIFCITSLLLVYYYYHFSFNTMHY